MAYLSFNNLGNYGRLGNQMFQYASLLGLANGSEHTPIANLSKSDLQGCFELGSVEDKNNDYQAVIQENGFAHNEQYSLGIQTANHLNIDLIGYFQTSKYFSEHNTNAEVRGNFTFKKEVRESAGEKLPEGVLVSLHVRRTDYTNLQDYHYNQNDSYYREAMEHFQEFRPVVFSDDIEWCKENMKWLGEDAVYTSNDQYTDLCLMSWCNGHIIANSSFSWWGAYLSGGKTVAPKNWFGPKGPQDWQDVYESDWIQL